MEYVKYTIEQINKISNLLNQIEVKGNSVTVLAMTMQELNNGDVVRNEEEGE